MLAKAIDPATIKSFLRALYRDAPKDALILLRAGETELQGSKAAPLPLTRLDAAAARGEPLAFAPALRDPRHPDHPAAMPVVWAHIRSTLPTDELLASLEPILPVAVAATTTGHTLFWRMAAATVDEAISAMAALSDALAAPVADALEYCLLPWHAEDVVIVDSAVTLDPQALAAVLASVRLPEFLVQPVADATAPVVDAQDEIAGEVLAMRARTQAPDGGPPPAESPVVFAGAATLTDALTAHQRLRRDEAWLVWAVREAQRVFGQRRTLELLGVDSLSTLQDSVCVRRGDRWYRVTGSVNGGFYLEIIS